MENRKFFDETAFIQRWHRDPKLRAEFGGKLEVYLAFVRAEHNGQVRIWPAQANPA